jgi:Mg2+ and Co2+ transporter CorA
MNRERIGLIVSIIGILLITLGGLYPLNVISHQTYLYILTLGLVFMFLGIAIRPERKKKSSKK